MKLFLSWLCVGTFAAVVITTILYALEKVIMSAIHGDPFARNLLQATGITFGVCAVLASLICSVIYLSEYYWYQRAYSNGPKDLKIRRE